jgi:[glutamine synthetase] adenylyltransferase / [glutamine synthetase]-adenylyl-L-tyrosine phosphorylase
MQRRRIGPHNKVPAHSLHHEPRSDSLSDFRAHHPEIFKQLQGDKARLSWLSTIANLSRFLSEELLRHPKWLWEIDEIERTLSVEDYKIQLNAFLQGQSTDTHTPLNLALFRRKELLHIGICDGLGVGSLAKVTEELSNLADAIIESALTAVKAEMEKKFGCPVTIDPSGKAVRATITVLALGKLGGRELNYSSDIDLMFFYSGNGETSGPHVITNQEFFRKAANQLTHLLSTYTAAGLCYRVDLRLRPEGTLGDVCISLTAAKEYYSKRARDWELQMLIKARVAAGDQALGQSLLDFVEPLIYSTTLDFSAVESMSATRERMAEKLQRKRHTGKGLDVKLAHGGIRDIEFLVQCMQRLHGGRETSVRHGGTLLALSGLRDKDLLSETEYAHLVDAYQFLRYVEHRLQFEEDRQTHTLSTEPSDLQRMARRMPPSFHLDTASEFLGAINGHLENVTGIYERIVHAQRPLSYTPNVVAFSLPPLPYPDEGRTVGLSEELLGRLDSVAPKLKERLQSRGVRRGEQLLAAFLVKLLSQPELLATLDDGPLLTENLLLLFEKSPFLSHQLFGHPEYLEEVRRTADHPAHRWAFEGLSAPLNDIGGLRRFFQREMFRIQAGSICMAEPIFQTLDNTSALAEYVIARAYRIAREGGLSHARRHSTHQHPFEEPQNDMAVVALGRLGMREFDLGSDADVLFIIPDNEAPRQRFWTRVAERLVEILTAYTGEMPSLSIDTRLRPNGREGPLVQTESKYVEYFSRDAEAWEGIAYMKARAIAGDTDRATKFLSELQQVDWRRYGQGGRSKQSLHQMRLRLQREQGSLAPLKASEGGYYDADFILMYLRLRGAGLFFKSLNTPERIDVVEKMGHLDREDAELLTEATTFFRALDHAIRIVTGRAEGKLPAAENEREMVAELVHQWTNLRRSAATVEEELAALKKRTRQLFERIFTA